MAFDPLRTVRRQTPTAPATAFSVCPLAAWAYDPLSTRGVVRVLMDVHPVLLLKKLKSRNLIFARPEPDGQPIESSQLEQNSFKWNRFDRLVIRAHAGIQLFVQVSSWMPAFAGQTICSYIGLNSALVKRDRNNSNRPPEGRGRVLPLRPVTASVRPLPARMPLPAVNGASARAC